MDLISILHKAGTKSTKTALVAAFLISRTKRQFHILETYLNEYGDHVLTEIKLLSTSFDNTLSIQDEVVHFLLRKFLFV